VHLHELKVVDMAALELALVILDVVLEADSDETFLLLAAYFVAKLVFILEVLLVSHQQQV